MFWTKWTFVAELSLRHWRRSWKIWKILKFFYKRVFSFLFFAFRSEFRIYLDFPSRFVFSAFFMWNVSVQLKRKLQIFPKFSKKVPKFLSFVGSEKFFLVPSIFKFAFVFWFLIWFQCRAMPTILEETLAIIEKLKIFQKFYNFSVWRQKSWLFFIKLQISRFLILVSDWLE